jgi:hypothetical protein
MEDQKQPENGEYFKYTSSITSDARCTLAVKYSSAMEKAASKTNLFTSKSDFYLRKKLVKFYTWSIDFTVLKIVHFGK